MSTTHPPLKQPECGHQFEPEPHCQPAFLVQYRCPTCGTNWSDVWSCACDSECPTCGVDIEALDAIEVAPCACVYLK